MIVDGRALAKGILARTKDRAAALRSIPHVGAIVVNESVATKSYLSIKAARAADAGCVLRTVKFPDNVSLEELRAVVESSLDDAIIAQLPLPPTINSQEVCNAIPISKDADVLSSSARERFEHGDNDALLPPVVAAVREVFEKYDVEVKNKKVVVIGAGFLVGAPCATWLQQQGATVEVLRFGSDLSSLKDAEIIISGAGSPHIIKPEMLKRGVVLIDAGTSESAGETAGDADPLCSEVCALFTPVPGGMGPLAVACLFSNAVTLAERATHRG